MTQDAIELPANALAHAPYSASETLSSILDIGKRQFTGVLLLVVLLHGVVFALWQQQKPRTKPTGNRTTNNAAVVQVSLLPAAGGKSQKALSDTALERAKITDKASESKEQKRQSSVKPTKKNSAKKPNPKPQPIAKSNNNKKEKTKKKPVERFVDIAHPQQKAPVLAAETKAQDKAKPLPRTAPQPVLEPLAQAEDDIDPMAMSGVEEVAPDAQPLQNEEEAFTDGEDDDTVLLPDMREAAGDVTGDGIDDGMEVATTSGGEVATDDDWLKTPVAPAVRRITPAEYANNPKPNYPSLSQKLNEQGTVQIRAVVNAQGRVQSLRVMQSSGFGMLDNAAKKAVRGWRFEPRMENGKAVSSEVDVPVVFRLQ